MSQLLKQKLQIVPFKKSAVFKRLPAEDGEKTAKRFKNKTFDFNLIVLINDSTNPEPKPKETQTNPENMYF